MKTRISTSVSWQIALLLGVSLILPQAALAKASPAKAEKSTKVKAGKEVPAAYEALKQP